MGSNLGTPETPKVMEELLLIQYTTYLIFFVSQPTGLPRLPPWTEIRPGCMSDALVNWCMSLNYNKYMTLVLSWSRTVNHLHSVNPLHLSAVPILTLTLASSVWGSTESVLIRLMCVVLCHVSQGKLRIVRRVLQILLCSFVVTICLCPYYPWVLCSCTHLGLLSIITFSFFSATVCAVAGLYPVQCCWAVHVVQFQRHCLYGKLPHCRRVMLGTH